MEIAFPVICRDSRVVNMADRRRIRPDLTFIHCGILLRFWICARLRRASDRLGGDRVPVLRILLRKMYTFRKWRAARAIRVGFEKFLRGATSTVIPNVLPYYKFFRDFSARATTPGRQSRKWRARRARNFAVSMRYRNLKADVPSALAKKARRSDRRLAKCKV